MQKKKDILEGQCWCINWVVLVLILMMPLRLNLMPENGFYLLRKKDCKKVVKASGFAEQFIARKAVPSYC